jgi:hypothetical protein
LSLVLDDLTGGQLDIARADDGAESNRLGLMEGIGVETFDDHVQ